MRKTGLRKNKTCRRWWSSVTPTLRRVIAIRFFSFPRHFTFPHHWRHLPYWLVRALEEVKHVMFDQAKYYTWWIG